jgi:hypothetical protein
MPRRRRLVVHAGLAAAGVLIFQLLLMTSGRVLAGDGLGWDGRGYARVMAEGLDFGSEVTRTRPLLPLVTRIPYSLGLDVIPSFQLMNAIYAFTLYLFTALILDAYGAGTRVKALIIGNLALCVATSKMFAYYPVQIDLGALAVMTAAFYFVVTDRHALAGAVGMLAVASREFGVVVVLCGLHRTYRRGQWLNAAWYLPAVLMVAVVRRLTYSEGVLSARDAIANVSLWLHPAFPTAFLYFTLTVLGGISALLVLQPRLGAAQLRREPELATYLIVIAGLSALGSLDVWRYLVFALPVALVLIARYFNDLSRPLDVLMASAMTFVTVMTQRPFQRMDQDLYFQDWFPLYAIIGPVPPKWDFLALWGMRLTAMLMILAALVLIRRLHPRVHEQTT